MYCSCTYIEPIIEGLATGISLGGTIIIFMVVYAFYTDKIKNKTDLIFKRTTVDVKKNQGN